MSEHIKKKFKEDSEESEYIYSGSDNDSDDSSDSNNSDSSESSDNSKEIRDLKMIDETDLDSCLLQTLKETLEYIEETDDYPTQIDIPNFAKLRDKYIRSKHLKRLEKLRYNMLPEWDSYIKLYKWYKENKIWYGDRVYSLENIKEFAKNSKIYG